MSSQSKRNKAACKKYREELIKLSKDLKRSQRNILNDIVNIGMAEMKRGTPVDTGWLREQWVATNIEARGKALIREILNDTKYGLFVNNGHRIVNAIGDTVGYKQGVRMLEKGILKARKSTPLVFAKEINGIKKEGNW